MAPGQTDAVSGAVPGMNMGDASAAAGAAATSAVASGPEPLSVPWMHHEFFRATKHLCCAKGGLQAAKKSSVQKATQELKKARVHLDEQLGSLELQLLNVTNYLNGKTNKLLIAPKSKTTDPLKQRERKKQQLLLLGATPAVLSNGKASQPKLMRQATAAGVAASAAATSHLADASDADAPCTSVGLWQFIDEQAYFKTLTVEEIGQSLDLEDESPSSPQHKEAQTVASAVDDATVDALLRERLLGAMLPLQSAENKVVSKVDHSSTVTPKVEASTDAKLDGSQTLMALREIGLLSVDGSCVRRSLSDPEDDDMSQDIRYAQMLLKDQIEHNNVRKQALRSYLLEKKPWISRSEEYQETERRYEKRERKRKEEQRKRKHKQKKLHRQASQDHHPVLNGSSSHSSAPLPSV